MQACFEYSTAVDLFSRFCTVDYEIAWHTIATVVNE